MTPVIASDPCLFDLALLFNKAAFESNNTASSLQKTSPTCQSHLRSPPTCQSHLTSPPTCQSHLTPPPACQSHLTSPLTCQNLVTPQQFTQCHFTSLLSLPPRPGGLLSHLLHMDLALRSLPRFHLPPGWCRVCEASGSRSLGGALSQIWLPLTTLQLHITHGLHLPSCTALTHSHPLLHLALLFNKAAF